MTKQARYLTHPQVAIDPSIPIPEWRLSETGLARVERLVRAEPWPKTTRIVASAERKAIDTAVCLAAAWQVPMEVRPKMHENDRSATGYLSPTAFEAAADRFFARPQDSMCGWETAKAAQVRILSEALDHVWHHLEGDVLFVGHGAVGTLLYCALAGLPIDRRYDQPHGGGNWFSFDIDSRQVRHHWRSMEEAFDAQSEADVVLGKAEHA
ncbi:MAG: histidine phosphatase family protein [Pseudomonadota bacterium]